MKLLKKCDVLWGKAEIFSTNPLVEIVTNGFYLPLQAHSAWGIFDGSGQAVSAAVDYREGVHPPPDQHLATDLRTAALQNHAPADTYIYAGRINPHFGHFLVNTLPRFWALKTLRSPGMPILCHGGGPPEIWFSVPFIAAIFQELQLTPADFVAFESPTVISNVIVPQPSLEEQKSGHFIYSIMCRQIGEQILSSNNLEATDRPLYYSKSKLKSAVGVITNENEIEPVLRAAGVDIVYPEELTFADQVRVMSSRTRIVGSAGSFFHTSIFCPPRHITCLNVTPQINTNFTIIDTLAGNNAAYYYPPAMEWLGTKDGFLTARYLPNACDVAEELLAAMAHR